MNSNFVIVLVDRAIVSIALLLLIPIIVLLVECLAALLPNKKQDRHRTASLSTRPTVTVLIPAHNEEVVIGKTISTILPQLSDGDRLLVIADNCSDRTAQIVRNFNVTVIERKDLQHRGKGFAVEYAKQFIKPNPPEILILLDADCEIEPNYIASLARLAMTSQRPVQPVNLLRSTDKSNLNSVVSELAFIVKNLVRPRGLARLRLPCMVTMGTAFPWAIFEQIPLASNNLVEDMQFGIDLAIAGNPPLFCADAKVTGVLPRRNQAATTQRTRWEHGHISTLITQVPRLLQEFCQQKRLDLFFLALDLSVPPLSLLVIIWSMIAGMGLTVGISQGKWLAFSVSMIEGIFLLVAIITAWAKFGRKIIPLKSLFSSIPRYVLRKISIYFAFVIKPQQQWIRTERDSIDSQIPKFSP